MAWFYNPVGDFSFYLKNHTHQVSVVLSLVYGLSHGPRSRYVQDGRCHRGVEDSEPVFWRQQEMFK